MTDHDYAWMGGRRASEKHMCRSTPTVMSVVGGDKETTTAAAAAAASSDLVLYGGEGGERRKIEGGGKKWVVDWVIGGEREGRKEGGSEPDGFHCHFGVLDKVTRRPKLVR